MNKKGKSDLITCSVSLILIFGLGWFIVAGLSEEKAPPPKTPQKETSANSSHHKLVSMEKIDKIAAVRKAKKTPKKKH